MGHARLAPSSAYRWMVCPGSVREEEGKPDTDNPSSLKGTAAHEAAAFCLKDGTTPGFWENQSIEVTKADGSREPIPITKDDVGALWVYHDYVSRRIDEMGGKDTVQVLVESETNPGIWLGRDDCKGTQDCGLIAPAELEFIDLKFGAGKAIEVDGNYQLQLYAIGELAKLDWTQRPTHTPVRMTVVQPRCPHPQGPIRSVTVPAYTLFALVDEFKTGAQRTDDPNAPLVPGDHCFFCKAKATCIALNQAAMDVFKPVPGVAAEGPERELQTDATGWDAIESTLGRPADQLGIDHMTRALDAEPLVSAWFKAIRERLTALAREGQTIPNHKLVESTTRRKWNATDEEIITKLARLRTTKGETVGKKAVMVEKPLSPKQAETQIQPVVSEKTWKNVAKLIIKPKGDSVLVPNTDPREAIKTAEEVFEKVEESESNPVPPWM